MAKMVFIALVLFVTAFMLTQRALGQTTTPTVSPSQAVPSGAPATGFGPGN